VQDECYRVKLADRSIDDLRRIRKRYGGKTYEILRDLIRDMKFEPEKKGERLSGPLRGLFSRHYSRFRIIYQVDSGEFVVLVVGCGFHETGSRKDVYKLIERAIEAGTIVIRSATETGQDASLDDD
jgi:mRNA-degrading endonuclease RelE of RelBE toxin-antitoxin system